MWAEVKYSHRASLIFDLIMFPYPTRSKKIRFLKKGLFFFLCILGPLAFNAVSIKMLLGIFGTKKNE